MMKTILKCIIGWLVMSATVHAAMPSAPAKVALSLPLEGKKFNPYSIEFSTNQARICIAGTDYDEMGTSTARLLLADRTHNVLAWQKVVAVPDELANLFPVQCLISADRVYLLANVDTSTSPPQAHTLAYVIAFDLLGNKVASKQVNVPGESRYGYAMSEAADGLQIVGYTKEQHRDTERYSTYTVTLDRTLQQRGTPLLRKNGAYTGPLGARMVGDSVYLVGRFFGGTASKEDLGQFAASRLRTNGGYTWSTRVALTDRIDFQLAVVDDGTSYSLGYNAGITTLNVITPDGKVPAALSFPSAYCETKSIARYGSGMIAVREPCSGKGNALVAIDVKAGKEQQLKSIPDEPLYVTAKSSVWAVLARDRNGKLYLYSGAAGGL